MDDDLLNLKQEVYQLTGDFSNAATEAFVALNSHEPAERVRPLVERCLSLGEVYEAALARLFSALRAAPAEEHTGEAGRVENLRSLLRREIDLILTHPRLAR
jgi:hypothetical protein